MAELPTGTVTMLFSDIEGSTLLLSRLGADYARALTGQRTVLRNAWAEHGGTEMGTEGDSFFVVFATATAAVSAAVQAQRELETYEWPRGEHVRVRMGVHTGSPTVLEDGYVGMDVHRAARVAGAAHGGQVVVSDATAHLVQGHLPKAVWLRDLGAHQLKDMPVPERLYQVAGEGLQEEFPAPKSLGTATSLPVPATPLVGRDGELEELTAVLTAPEVRLVTLTGPGGSGKTRLAIGLAHELTDAFPDGVYFVPLATVTTPEVMWTTIAEVLDVPPEGRLPPGFFTHVAHRTALFVLDNLEQLPAADGVVAELLAEAEQLVVIATSRRPLHVQAEHEHAVPTLELPEADGVDDTSRAGAVQLFVQRAHQVRSDFALTPGNAADVAAICRRLDGLPLAVELAAARSKLLSPKALLSRLDTALDIAVTGSLGPSRHRTLRETIAWSYDLLTSPQQEFFRQLGVFSGGADLDAITAVIKTEADPGGTDPLDMVADLVDASLVTVIETSDGEPRVRMLETVRAYTLDQLTESGELEPLQARHTHHYLAVAEDLNPQLEGEQHASARSRLEAEHDNLREALSWTLQPHQPDSDTTRAPIGLRLCIALARFWRISGYYSESRRWLEQAVESSGGDDSPELADCRALLGLSLADLGELDRARDCATASVEMWRRMDRPGKGLARALRTLASIEQGRGHPAIARPLYDEALRIARASGDKQLLHNILGYFATFESVDHDNQRSYELDLEALAIARELRQPTAVIIYQHNLACDLRLLGRMAEAEPLMRSLIPEVLRLKEPGEAVVLAEDYGAVLALLGDHQQAVRLLGAADAMRDRLGTPRVQWQADELAEPFAKARAGLTTQEWDDAFEAGRNTSVEDALSEAHAMDERP